MSDYPDFAPQHYQIKRELGLNRAGGRVTYLATDTRTQQQVVIKQFQFARLGASWADYDAYEREIQLLKELNHPGIPRYLHSFQTETGFCMVQEYKPATSLADSRSFNPEQIRQIAIAALEVLVYLQNRIPPIIHRDIKPENILVDEVGNLFLVDFGFARVGDGEVGVSSVVKGTLGFMPPEQLFNRQLTEASDLYGLGMTLICLLTGTKSDRIGDLVDISYRVSFRHLIPNFNVQWVNWLEKMVEPRLKDRYPNALAALDAVPTSPLRPPEAQFSQSKLIFAAGRVGEQLIQTLSITNPIPETTLEGAWQLEPHLHDPEAERYQWISVTPQTFRGNQTEFQIMVDTRRLMAGKTYHRRLVLQANTLAKFYPLNLQVQTAPILVKSQLLPYGLLTLACLFFTGISWLGGWMVLVVRAITESSDVSGFSAMLGAAIGLEGAAWLMRSSEWRVGSAASTLAAIFTGALATLRVLTEATSSTGSSVIAEALVGGVEGAITGIVLGTMVEKMIVAGTQKGLAILISLLTTLLGISLGLSLILGTMNLLNFTLLVFSSLSLVTLIIQRSLSRAHVINTHRKAERYLIKP